MWIEVANAFYMHNGVKADQSGNLKYTVFNGAYNQLNLSLILLVILRWSAHTIVQDTGMNI